MDDLPIRGKGRGRTVRATRIDTPPVVVEDIERIEERSRGVIRRGGRPRGRPAAPSPRRRGPTRAVRVDTPQVVVEEVADSEGQSMAQPQGPQVEFQP